MPLTPEDGKTADERTVLRFMDMWKAQDIEGMLGIFTDDASYIDMPLPPRHGPNRLSERVAEVCLEARLRRW